MANVKPSSSVSSVALPWRRIWITGAGKGIGAALVEALAHYPVELVISSRTETDLRELRHRLAELPASIHLCPLDICDATGVNNLVQSWADEDKLPDLAILNAGTHMPFSAREFDAKKARDLLEVNLHGSLNCIAPLLQQAFHGASASAEKVQSLHIGLVASVAGYRGLPTASVYGASKAALIHLAESLHTELQGSPVRVQVINPGFVRTPLTDKNEFEMPALMEPQAAAEAILKGLQSNRFEVSFPARFVVWLKCLRLLPYSLYFALIKKFVPNP